MTNADKVRSMSDEELVQFMMSDPPCDALYAHSCALHSGNCEECVREWLRATVDAGEQSPLTRDQLRQMVGSWVWVVVNYENDEASFQCDGWAKVVTYGTVSYFDQSLKVAELGTRFQAYAQPVSNFGVRIVSRKEDVEHAKPE